MILEARSAAFMTLPKIIVPVWQHENPQVSFLSKVVKMPPVDSSWSSLIACFS